ncbi:hypothetical protein [Mesorhizobium marinum]|uniref:hypothetical protein n=1 Tax=Mesorhizobium marinum TaxID=3228790 RepID=UPI003467E0BF
MPTRYKFPFEDDFNYGCCHVQNSDMEPCPNAAQGYVRLVGHAIEAEPVSEPVIIERERESARDRFEGALRAWPTGPVDDRKAALNAWNQLSDEDKYTAVAEIQRYLDINKSVGRRYVCALATYLQERRWEGLSPRPVAPPRPISAPPVQSRPTAFMLANPHLFPERFGQAEVRSADA